MKKDAQATFKVTVHIFKKYFNFLKGKLDSLEINFEIVKDG